LALTAGILLDFWLKNLVFRFELDRYEIYMMSDYNQELKADWGYVFNTNGKKTSDVMGTGTGQLKLTELEVYSVV
jgi:hypothetical protein